MAILQKSASDNSIPSPFRAAHVFDQVTDDRVNRDGEQNDATDRGRESTQQPQGGERGSKKCDHSPEFGHREFHWRVCSVEMKSAVNRADGTYESILTPRIANDQLFRSKYK